MLMIKITVWALPHTKWRHYMEIITRNEKILYIGILFYGFKPHGVCSEKGVLESVVFTSGNINDSKMVEKVTENMKAWFYCDAGYLKKCGELVRLAESGRFICAAARRNMKLLCNFSLRSSMQAEIIA